MEPRTSIYNSLIQIMAWIVLTVFGTSCITFMILKSHAGIEAFITTQSHWTLAQTRAKNHLDDYLKNYDELDFQSYKNNIQTCLKIRSSIISFEKNDFVSGKQFLNNSQLHQDTVMDTVFLYRQLIKVPQVKTLLSDWKSLNRKIYEFDAMADLTYQAIKNQVPEHLIKLNKTKIEQAYKQIKPLEDKLKSSIRNVTSWIRTVTFWLTATIYTLLGLMLFLGIRRTLSALHIRDALYHATFHQANVGIIQMDLKGKIHRMNQAFCHIFAVTAKEMKGRLVTDILEYHQNKQPQDTNILSQLTPDDPTFSYHFKINSRKAKLLWLKATITKIYNQQNKPLYHIAMIEDITELHEANEQLKQMAHHDYLTGLSNKFSFDKYLSNAVNKGQKGVLFCMDLDKFKKVNDSAGHAAGDRALTEVAHVLRLCFKKEDMVARIGGDEFAAFVTDIDMATANNIKTGIIRAIEQHLITYEGKSFHISISIGLAPLDSETISSKQLMLQADSASYEAKSKKV